MLPRRPDTPQEPVNLTARARRDLIGASGCLERADHKGNPQPLADRARLLEIGPAAAIYALKEGADTFVALVPHAAGYVFWTDASTHDNPGYVDARSGEGA